MRRRTEMLSVLLAALQWGCHPAPMQRLSVHPSLIAVRDSASYNPAATAFLAPFKAGVDTQMNVVLGRAALPLTKAQPESTLGNLVADAQLLAARKVYPGTVASVVNFGGIRTPFVPAGNITRRTIYEIMPFDNMICVVDLPGRYIDTFCQAMAQRKGWPVSGITFTIREGRAEHILLNGTPPDPHLVYPIAVSDYLAGGGDHCDFLRPMQRRVTSVLLREALMDYVRAKEASGVAVSPGLEDRIRYAE